MTPSHPSWSPPGGWTSQWRGLFAGIVVTACVAGLVRHQPPSEYVSAGRASSQGPNDGGSLARSEAIHRALAQTHGKLIDEWSPDGKGDMLLQELWELFGPTSPCHERERYGDILDGGKWTDSTATRRVCSAHAVLSREPCWVFSLGSNGQTDFEEAIRSRYSHCKIHVYDPTISEEVAAKVAEVTQATVHRTWIVSEEGLQQHHAAQAARENDADQYTTLTREMQQLGTPWLNILKVDIEGSEWQVLEEILNSNATAPFSEILVELHIMSIPEAWGSDVRHRLRYFFDRLAAQGYRITNNELNLRCAVPAFSTNCFQYVEYTLMKTDTAGNIVLAPQ